MNTIVEGIEVDACWPGARLVDGYGLHRGRRVFHDDLAKTRRLALAGWTVLRYTSRDVTRGSARVVAELREAEVGERRAVGGARRCALAGQVGLRRPCDVPCSLLCSAPLR